jgi:hypothetical protein
MVFVVANLITKQGCPSCFICCMLSVVVSHLTLHIIPLVTNGGTFIHITFVLTGQNITYCMTQSVCTISKCLCACCIIRCAFVTSLSNFCNNVLIQLLLLTLTSSSITSARCSFNMGNNKSWWAQPDKWAGVNGVLALLYW